MYDVAGRTGRANAGLVERLGHGPIPMARDALVRAEDRASFSTRKGDLLNVYELPVTSGDATLGALAIFQDATYIESREARMWRHALAGLVVQTALIVCVTLLILAVDSAPSAGAA